MTIRCDLDAWKRIEQIGVCASSDQARPILTAVYIAPGDDKLTVTATDSYRLATTILEADCEPSDPILFPAKTAKDIRLAISKVSGLGKNPDLFIKVKNHEARVAAVDADETPRFMQTVRLVEGNFPQYQAIFPADDEGLEGLTKAQLLAFVGEYGELNGLSERSRKDELLTAAQRCKIGPAYAAFNAGYLASMSVAAAATDRYPVQLRVRGPLKPVVLTSPADKNWRGLVMPVRT